MRNPIKPTVILSAATTVQTGSVHAQDLNHGSPSRVVHSTVSGSGVVSATILIYGSTNFSATNGVLLATLSPSGTTSASDGVAITAPWPFVWADLTAISGTSASCTVTVGN